MFDFLKQSAFGLDLSDQSFKIINLAHKGKDKILSSYYRQEIPVGVIERGEIRDEEQIVGLLKEAKERVKGNKLSGRECVVSLPETEAFIRLIQLPQMKTDELKEAIRWEAEANIPLPIDEIYLDWQVVAQNLDNQDVLIGALPRNLVDSYLQVIKKAGFRPVAFEIESIATARAVVKTGVTRINLIVDFGAERTSFILASGSLVFFTANSAIGNNRLIKDIADVLKIDREEAKRVKFEAGLNKLKDEGQVFKALEPSLKDLLKKIKGYISFYESHHWPGGVKSDSLDEIILCGGGANLAGLTDLIYAETGIRTKIANPWVNILQPDFKELPELPYQESITYATAIGLAMRGLDLSDHD